MPITGIPIDEMSLGVDVDVTEASAVEVSTEQAESVISATAKEDKGST